MRGRDLQNKIVRDREGRRLGRVHELHLRNGVVTSFVVGPVGWLQRFMATRAGRRIAWRSVTAVEPDVIRVHVSPRR